MHRTHSVKRLRHAYRFGDFRFETTPVRLVGPTGEVALQPQPARVLHLFLERSGELITRDQIRRHVWGDEVLREHEPGINYIIKTVRQALKDQPQTPRYIETVPRQGYRFVATVEPLSIEDSLSWPWLRTFALIAILALLRHRNRG